MEVYTQNSILQKHTFRSVVYIMMTYYRTYLKCLTWSGIEDPKSSQCQNIHSKVHTVVVYTFNSAFYKCPQEALENLLSLQWQFGHSIVSWISQMCMSKEHKTSSPHKVWTEPEPETESTTKKSLYVSNPLTNLIICSLIRVRWCTTLILGNVLLNACISSFHYYTSQCAVHGYRELNKLWFIISLNLVLTTHFS